MTTIERNYRKNPHTARFLQTFHTAVGSNGVNYRADLDDNAAEYALAQEDDLLNAIPEVADLRSPAQATLMVKLIAEIRELDAAMADTAQAYTDGMTQRGLWERGQGSNTSRWIGNMIAKANELGRASRATAPAAQVTDGRYAVEVGGTLKFYRVKNGKRAGYVFLDVRASDDWYPVRNLGQIRAIVSLIAKDPKAAMIRYGHELGECGMCGRTLTDETSRAAGIGPICASK